MFDRSLLHTLNIPGGVYSLAFGSSEYSFDSSLALLNSLKSNILPSCLLSPTTLKFTRYKCFKFPFCNGFTLVKHPWVDT